MKTVYYGDTRSYDDGERQRTLNIMATLEGLEL